MDQEKPLIDEPNALENLRANHHGATIDDIHLGDGGRRSVLDRNRFPFEETRVARPIKYATVRHDLVRLVHEIDHRTEYPVIGVRIGSGEKIVAQRRGNDGVVVEQQNLIGAAFKGVTNANVVATSPAAVGRIADEVAPGKLGASAGVGSCADALSTTTTDRR